MAGPIRSWSRAALGVVVALVSMGSTVARACSAPAPDFSALARAYPMDGDVGVPTNVELTLEYVGLGWCDPSLLPADVVLRPAGSTDPADAVPVTRTSLERYPRWIRVVHPDVELAPMTAYEVVGTQYPDPDDWECLSGVETVLLTFTTGAGPDVVPPTLGPLAWGCEVRQIRTEAETCDCLDVTVRPLVLGSAVSDDGDPAGIVFEVYAESGDAVPLVPRWSSDVLHVLQPVDGYGPFDRSDVMATPGAFLVVAIDGAGNASEPTLVSPPSPDCPDPAAPSAATVGCWPIADGHARCSIEAGAAPATPLAWIVVSAWLAVAAGRLRPRRLRR